MPLMNDVKVEKQLLHILNLQANIAVDFLITMLWRQNVTYKVTNQ